MKSDPMDKDLRMYVGKSDKEICKVCKKDMTHKCTYSEKKSHRIYIRRLYDSPIDQIGGICVHCINEKDYILVADPFNLSLAVKHTAKMKRESDIAIMKIFIKRALK